MGHDFDSRVFFLAAIVKHDYVAFMTWPLNADRAMRTQQTKRIESSPLLVRLSY